MNETIVKPLFRYVQTSINLIAVSCMMMNILLLGITTSPLHAKPNEASVLRSISWPEIESLLSKRSFVSEEELFQLLYQLYSQQQDMIRLEKPVIQKLAGTIKSLFPLDACESMIFQNGTVSNPVLN